MMNDPLIKELFDIIEDMKDPPEGLEDVAEIAAELERDVKNTIFEAALEPVVPADMTQLIEKADALNKLIADYAEAQKDDDTSEMTALLQKIRELGAQLTQLGSGDSV